MYEARLTQGNLLKKIVDAIKDLVTEANFDVNSTGFGLQAMDNSHVSLVALQLRADGFEHYRCDRSMSMGKQRCTELRSPVPLSDCYSSLLGVHSAANLRPSSGMHTKHLGVPTPLLNIVD